MPERVEVPTKTTRLPVHSNRGEVWQYYTRIWLLARKDIEASESVNSSQLNVGVHLMEYIPSGCETSTYPGHSAHNDRDIGIPDSTALEIANSHHG